MSRMIACEMRSASHTLYMRMKGTPQRKRRCRFAVIRTFNGRKAHLPTGSVITKKAR